jgi:hypothetical protein
MHVAVQDFCTALFYLLSCIGLQGDKSQGAWGTASPNIIDKESLFFLFAFCAFFSLSQPITLPISLKDMATVCEPVKQGTG